MRRCPALSLAFACGILTMLFAPVLCAQLPRRLKNCLPHPTLADEVKQMQDEIEAARPKVHVVQVIFEGADALPKTAKAELTHRAEELRPDPAEDWPAYIAEDVKGAMQDRGYFTAAVRPEVHVLSRGPKGEEAAITLHVVPGPRYRLGRIQVVNARAFPITELRKQVPLQTGDIFDLSKVRAGIGNLTEFYSAHGYINFMATPALLTDDLHRRISVTLQAEEGQQFRVGSVQVLGLEHQMADRSLKLDIEPGMVFSPKLVEDFYRQNAALLPADASPKEDTSIIQNPHTDTVAITFDLRGCP